MKKLKRLIAGLLIFTPAAVYAQIAPCLPGASNCYGGYIVNTPAQVVSQIFPIDLAKYSSSKVSAQVIYSSANLTSPTFTSGSESVSSITVVAYAGLSTAAATGQATIVSTNSLGGAQIRVNNNVLVNGTDWFTGATKQLTAVSLAAAIAKIPNVSASAAGGIVYTTATPVGSYANVYAFTSNNSSVTMSGATLSGGQDNAVLTINGKAISQGFGAGQWAAQTSNAVTAANLATAINAAFATLTSTDNAAGTGAIVYATSTLNGTAYNYSIVSSTQNSLKVNSGSAFVGGANPGLTLGSGNFYSVGTNGLTLGLPVLYAVGANSAIGGLTTGATYYAVPKSNAYFQLALYSTSAVAGIPASDFVTVTSTNSSVTAQTYTIAPLAWAGTASFIWQSSNDNSNWATLPLTTSVSFTSSTAATDALYDFGFYNFRYIRLNYTAPTSGAASFVVPVSIKQDGIGPF